MPRRSSGTAAEQVEKGQNRPKNANDHEQRVRVHPALPSYFVVVPAPELSSIDVAVINQMGRVRTFRKRILSTPAPANSALPGSPALAERARPEPAASGPVGQRKASQACHIARSAHTRSPPPARPRPRQPPKSPQLTQNSYSKSPRPRPIDSIENRHQGTGNAGARPSVGAKVNRVDRNNEKRPVTSPPYALRTPLQCPFAPIRWPCWPS
jgi:hypothetical protein